MASPSYKDIRVVLSKNLKKIFTVTLHDKVNFRDLKQEIGQKLHSEMPCNRFFLLLSNDNGKTWENLIDVDNSNVSDVTFPQDALLSVEPYGTSNDKGFKLMLKLCKKSMDKTDFVLLDIPTTMTISEIKEKAQRRIDEQKNNDIYIFTKDGWIKLEPEINDLTLCELEYDNYSFISFGNVKDYIPGVCGLTNLGNTCFMNSALQCLSNIPKLTEMILSFNNTIDAPIICEYRNLIKSMWSGKSCVTTPSFLLSNICENLPRFSKYRQQDAQEFMNCFLHLVHEEFTNENTFITEFFYGQIQSTIKCLGGCESIEKNTEHISFIPLPIGEDLNKYNILFLKNNGKYISKSLKCQGKRVEDLIKLFIQDSNLPLLPEQIKAVRIMRNTIYKEYCSFDRLRDIVDHQVTFIEYPTKRVDETYVQVEFVNHKTYEAFRPPLFFVCPSYDCTYSGLFTQIDPITKHLRDETGAVNSSFHYYWVDNDNKFHRLENGTSESSYFKHLKKVTVEMDEEYVQKYRKQFDFSHPNDALSLDSLLSDFFREEILNGKYYCSKCGQLQTAKQKSDFVLPLPKVLIIQLKRFTYDIYSDAKIDSYIDFPLRGLNLAQYVMQDSARSTRTPILYDLVAVSNHTGTLTCGHYITYAKNDQNKKWYSFNDEITREIHNEKDIVTKNAYILVYVQQTTK